jgi:hydroxymethylbilane synthase
MRLGTRGSQLALTQARLVAELLGGAEVVKIQTSGDDGDGDKSRWVDGLEQALLAGEIDLAVHSAKDLPGELASGLELLGAPARAPAQDVLCGTEDLGSLPSGARVGTTSLRRIAQLRAVREDLEIVAVNGNVDTRLRKLDEGDCEALVLAHAGLQRLGRERHIGAILDPAVWVPAPGQGTLALEGRADEQTTSAAAQAITDADTLACLRAERALARSLGASCNTPLGTHATPSGEGHLQLRAWVGLPDGSVWIRDELSGERQDPEQLGHEVAERMRLAGAEQLLRAAEELANHA